VSAPPAWYSRGMRAQRRPHTPRGLLSARVTGAVPFAGTASLARRRTFTPSSRSDAPPRLRRTLRRATHIATGRRICGPAARPAPCCAAPPHRPARSGGAAARRASPRPARSVYPAQGVCCRSPSLCPSPLPLRVTSPCLGLPLAAASLDSPPSAARPQEAGLFKDEIVPMKATMLVTDKETGETSHKTVRSSHYSRLTFIIVDCPALPVARDGLPTFSLLPLSRHSHFLPPPPLLAAASLRCSTRLPSPSPPPPSLRPPAALLPTRGGEQLFFVTMVALISEQRLTRCSRIATSATGPAPRSRPSRG